MKYFVLKNFHDSLEMSQQQSNLTGYLNKNWSSSKPNHQETTDRGDDDDDDISIVKVTKPPKMKWVTSTFDDFGSDFDLNLSQPKAQTSRRVPCQQSKLSRDTFSQPSSRKRPRETADVKKRNILVGRHKYKVSLNMELWAEKHHPNSKSDLAVHKKKIEEVEGWMNHSLTSGKERGKILLLTGPSGAGKTATVQILCQELNLSLQEWSNPVQSSQNMEVRTQDYWDRSLVDIQPTESQQKQFENFLLRANKYEALQLGGESEKHLTGCRGRVILVEEFPNVYLRDPTLFHNILRRYRRVGQSLLVFIISDSSRGESKERQLFPPDLQIELGVHNISFNPVAPTTMVKLLSRVTNIENKTSSGGPSTSVIESIAMSSSGDIRSAINALQFACRQDTFDLNSTCKTQRGARKGGKGSGSKLKYESSKKQDGAKDTTSELAGIGARDTSCFLFHAIGKILYCKRGDPSTYTNLPHLPPHMSHHERDPLLIDPEDVIEKSQVSGDYFASFLHQNYVDFFTNIDDVVVASEYLSMVDSLSTHWSTKTALEKYSTSLASRGIIHANTSNARFDAPRSGAGWRPLHKSQWFTVQRQAKRNAETGSRLFRGYHWDPEVLWTEILPSLNQINVTLRNPAQINFIQEMGRFSQRSNQARFERLDEHEVIGDDEPEMTSLPVSTETDFSNEQISNSQSEVKTKSVEDVEEEEIEIDEYIDSD